MIGSALKKLAKANGMTVAHGVAYGVFRGYAATFSEGSGYKQIVITTQFTDPAKLSQLQAVLNQQNISREYRVQSLNFAPDGIQIIFQDTIGTMKKVEAFLDFFMPLLPEHSATGANICTECGCEITTGQWKLIDGVAFHLHSGCAQKIRNTLDEVKQQPLEGSYVTGAVGAFLGAALGAVAWAVILLVGYVASIVGFLIGFLANKGYDLCKGKQGKGKIVILILAVIFGVVLGNVGADAFTLGQMITAGELPGFTFADIPLILFSLIVEDSQYLTATLANMGMGLLFAALGVFALIAKAGKEVSGTKMIDL